jgi:hypothetical protein
MQSNKMSNVKSWQKPRKKEPSMAAWQAVSMHEDVKLARIYDPGE